MSRSEATHAAKARLSRESWIAAAFDEFTQNGLQAISIEKLAKQLGATRGSFYWHYSSRDELIGGVLTRWQQCMIGSGQRLRKIADPRERLRAFLNEGIADLDLGRREVNLLSLVDSPNVRKAVEEYALARTDFVEQALKEAGHSPEDARMEAIQSWALWIGAYQLATSMPDVIPGATLQEKLATTTRSLLARILDDDLSK